MRHRPCRSLDTECFVLHLPHYPLPDLDVLRLSPRVRPIVSGVFAQYHNSFISNATLADACML